MNCESVNNGSNNPAFKLQCQKKTFHASEKESDRVQKKRIEFWQKIRDIPAKDLVFLDESGVSLAILRIDARALKGHRAEETNRKKADATPRRRQAQGKAH